jgi:hypothetical protein
MDTQATIPVAITLTVVGLVLVAGSKMSAPSKANVDKLVNPARLKTNHQAGTEPGV